MTCIPRHPSVRVSRCRAALKGGSHGICSKRSLVAAGVALVALSISPGVVFCRATRRPPPGQDNSLQNRVTALEGQVTALQGQVATLEGLVQGLLAADVVLQGNINAEAVTRAAADTALQDAIGVEEAARIAGDNTEAAVRAAADGFLQMRIDDLGDAALVAGFVTVNPDPMNGLAGPHIIFEGANVHVRRVPERRTMTPGSYGTR